jgi:hypothetical protein
MGALISISDISGDVPAESFIAEQLATVPVERALDWVAHNLALIWHSGNLDETQARLAAEWFGHDPAAHAALLKHLRAGSRLLVAPVLKLTAMLAAAHGADNPAGDHENQEAVSRYLTRTLPMVMLTVAHYYGDTSYGPSGTRPAASGTVGADEIPSEELEIAASVLANHQPYPQSMFDRSERRWIELPAADTSLKKMDLAEQFHAATGADFRDLRTVGLVLHARALNPRQPLRVGEDYLEKLNLGPQRLAAVLEIISISLADLSKLARAKLPTNLYDTPLLNRYPLIRLNGGQLLVMGPDLVAERTYGWLPKFDIEHGSKPRTAEDKSTAARAVGYLQSVTEIHARETLSSVASAPVTEARVFGETEIQKAWGTSRRNADTVLLWPQAAVVAEISSRPPSLNTLLALSEGGLAHDLDLGVIDKAAQLHATIEAFRAEPAALTGQAATPQRFRPVLVTTEGFPVTPLTMPRIRQLLARDALLQDADVAPLVITDIDALEAAEAIAERAGPDLAELLAAHEASEMANYGFREWLLLSYPGTGAPTRVRKRWARVREPVMAALIGKSV